MKHWKYQNVVNSMGNTINVSFLSKNLLYTGTQLGRGGGAASPTLFRKILKSSMISEKNRSDCAYH